MLARVLVFLTGCLLAGTAPALQPGDVMVTGYRADSPDGLRLVVWVDLPAGQELFFTDKGWTAAETFRAGEDFAKWTVPAGGWAAGTEVSFDFSVPSASAGTLEGDPGLSGGGDQILIFTGTTNAPEFLFGFNYDGPVWNDDAVGNSSSALPASLTNETGNMAIDHFDNGMYTGAHSGFQSVLQREILNTNNWTFGNSGDGFDLTPAFFDVVPQEAGAPILELDPAGLCRTATVGQTVSFFVILSAGAGELFYTRANGLPGGSDYPSGIQSGTGGLTNRFEWTPSEPGDHRIEFTAWNADGTNRLEVCLDVILPDLSGALIINEYSGVSKNRYLGSDNADGTNYDLDPETGQPEAGEPGRDTFFGRIRGNGGNWIELVVVEDHLDLRGWRILWAEADEPPLEQNGEELRWHAEEWIPPEYIDPFWNGRAWEPGYWEPGYRQPGYWALEPAYERNWWPDDSDPWFGERYGVDGTQIKQGIIEFSDAALWSDLRAGTLITLAEKATVMSDGGTPVLRGTDVSFDPASGDWWIHISARDESGRPDGLIRCSHNQMDEDACSFSTGHHDWQGIVQDGWGRDVFGPVGERIAGWDGGKADPNLSSVEVGMLETDPGGGVGVYDFDDKKYSSFAGPNLIDEDPDEYQNFSALRSWLPGAAPLDVDQNGLADAWELVQFEQVRNDPEADPDGDRMSNRSEYFIGSSPRAADAERGRISLAANKSDAASANSASATSSGQRILRFYGAEGRWYRIEAAPAPAGPWSPAGNWMAVSNDWKTISINASMPQQFYRLKIFYEPGKEPSNEP